MAAVRTLRMLVFSLITGLLMYLGAVVFLLHPAPSSRLTLTFVAAGLWVMSFALAWSISASARSRVRREHATSPLSEASLVTAWMSASIPRMAILEGPGLMGVIAYQLDGQWFALVPAALSVLAMLMSSLDQYRRFHEEITGIRKY